MSDWEKYYRFYHDAKEYSGTDAFHLWAGDLSQDDAKKFAIKTLENRYGVVGLKEKKDVICVPEDSFIIYQKLLKFSLPDFEWHGWNHFANPQNRQLLARLESMKISLNDATNLQTLNVVCGGHLPTDEQWDFKSKKARVTQMTEDFIDISQRAVKIDGSLWMDGL